MNWAEFFAMNGYGVYVWGSYGVALLIFVVEIALIIRKRAAVVQAVRLLRAAGEEE